MMMKTKESINILLIDDDKDDQFFFIRALKDFDSTIVCQVANDGLKGLIFLENNPNPDIIFLDLNMPKMNGFDFLEKIKKDEKMKNIPVVIFTTSNHYKDIKKAGELKAVAFLTKPNNINNLSAKLSQVLNLDYTLINDIKIID
jgi:CheY-like chemotaxis protein